MSCSSNVVKKDFRNCHSSLLTTTVRYGSVKGPLSSEKACVNINLLPKIVAKILQDFYFN